MPMLGIMASAISGNLLTYPISAYDSIATATVTSGNQTTITFSSVPQTYTHLQIRGIARGTYAGSGGGNPITRFNSDSGTNYVVHRLGGNGASAYAQAGLTQTSISHYGLTGANDATGMFGAFVIDILDYTNTNKNKVVRMFIADDMNGSGNIQFGSGVWLNTAAISTITLTTDYADFFANSSFALYGIK